MTGAQILVNILIAVVAFALVGWAFTYASEVPGLIVFLVQVIVAVLVFVYNVAARFGVR